MENEDELEQLLDTSKVKINAKTVRNKVKKDAEDYRNKLKQSLEGKVLSVSIDMASSDGRCFLGKSFVINIFVQFYGILFCIFLGLNAQYFDATTGSIKLVCLACKEVFDSHHGVHIKEWIKEVLKDFGINSEQLLGLSIDSGADITKGVDDMIKELSKKDYSMLQPTQPDVGVGDAVSENGAESEDEEEVYDESFDNVDDEMLAEDGDEELWATDDEGPNALFDFDIV